MSADRPCVHGTARLVEIPVHWMLDDAPHFWFDATTWTKRIAPVEEVRAIWLDEFEGITATGGCTVFTLHPQIIGRPSRLAMLDDVMATVRRDGDVWTAPCRAVAGALLVRRSDRRLAPQPDVALGSLVVTTGRWSAAVRRANRDRAAGECRPPREHDERDASARREGPPHRRSGSPC